MAKILILGAGSAGKRHAINATIHGHSTTLWDPILCPSSPSLSSMLDSAPWAAVVIASPPAAHLDQIEQAAQRGIRTICEKPLCDIGQFARAAQLTALYGESVMVTYNYRYHSGFWPSNQKPTIHNGWRITSSQQRTNHPEWGYLLDNISHAVDMLTWRAGPITITGASHAEHRDTANNLLHSNWQASGISYSGLPVSLEDKVYTIAAPRRVTFKSPTWYSNIGRDASMFLRMWENINGWLSNLSAPYPTMRDALTVQRHLETINQLGGHCLECS